MKRLISILILVIVSCCLSKHAGVVQMSPRDMVEQLKLKHIDAFVAWEPFPSEAVVRGYGKILVTSSDIWKNHPCCVIAAKRNLSDEVLTAFIWAHVKATEFINNKSNEEKTIEYAVEFTGRSRDVIKSALKNIKFVDFPDVKEFKKYYEKLKDFGYLTRSPVDLGYKSEDDFFKDFIYEKPYKIVKAELSKNKNWIPKRVNVTLRVGYLSADLHQLAFYIAVKEGYFEKVGIKVIPKVFENGVLEMDGFRSDEIDIGYLGSAPVTLKRINENVDVRIVAGVNNEGSAIVVRSDLNITDIKELSKLKVAIPGYGTVQDFLLRMAMKAEQS